MGIAAEIEFEIARLDAPDVPTGGSTADETR